MNSEIILCKNIKMDRNYNNVLNYTEEQMVSLCRQNQIASADDYSFLRSTGSIWVGFTYNQCLQANYIAFQNKDYSNKWFFAWIDDIIYKNDRNVEIRFTIDAWSTWFSKVTTKKCFINRQHVNDDTIGLNTIDENLSVGEVVEEAETEDVSLSQYFWVVVSTAWFPDDNTTTGGKQYNGISVYNRQVFGNRLALFKINTINDFLNLALFIIRTNGDGHIADIDNIFIVPSAVVDETKLTLHTLIAQLPDSQTQNFSYYTTQYSMDIEEIDFEVDKIVQFSDYIPKNNKVFVYPYNYLLVSNNIGNVNIFRYENFYNSNKATFKIQLALNVGCSGRLLPTNYKNMTTDDDESLPLAKYPTCSWSSDAFTNWLTQQAVNLSTNLATSLVSEMVGYGKQKSNISTVQGGSTGVSIASTIAEQIGIFYSGELMPNIQGGSNTGDICFGAERNTFTFRCMRVKTEFLKIIDDYFTRYGYAIKSLENPNITGRRNWNYVEIGATEEIGYGEVPSKYMEQINNACRKGVTIWHNHSNLGNFNLENDII